MSALSDLWEAPALTVHLDPARDGIDPQSVAAAIAWQPVVGPATFSLYRYLVWTPDGELTRTHPWDHLAEYLGRANLVRTRQAVDRMIRFFPGVSVSGVAVVLPMLLPFRVPAPRPDSVAWQRARNRTAVAS